MKALIFPGQGSQIVGMGEEFYNKFKEVKKIFQLADERLNYPISKLILEGPSEKLQLTENTQPAILTVSYSIFKTLKNQFDFDLSKVEYMAGHSLGEYSALVCAEALDFSDALYLLHERGKAMQNAVPIGKGEMIAVLGSTLPEITKIIKTLDLKDGVCEIANDNADGQAIVSGDVKNMESFKLVLKKNKIKFIPLKVSAPFHCSLMKSAASKMEEKINKTNFRNPTFKIINNVEANIENDTINIKRLLFEQIYSTVRWRESIIRMADSGVKKFIEIGPGKALSGMVKRTAKDVKCFSINSIADIESLKDEH